MYPAAPALSRWLSRGVRGPDPARTMEQAALALFEVAAESENLPVAPFRYLADSARPPAGCCWCLDPVHLRADSHGLILFDAETCRLAAHEREALFATLSAFLAEAGWRLEASPAQRWYLFGPAADELHSTPLSRVCGKPVADFLPRGGGAREWMQRSNEVQMLLHAHPVNRERVARGVPAINSVWLWGGGVLPEARRARFDQVYSDDPLVRGLALWGGCASRALPCDCGVLLQLTAGAQQVLLVADACRAGAEYGDVQGWASAVAGCERDWFEPLLAALAKRRFRELELIALNGCRYRLRRRDLWRFWRRAGAWYAALTSAA